MKRHSRLGKLALYFSVAAFLLQRALVVKGLRVDAANLFGRRSDAPAAASVESEQVSWATVVGPSFGPWWHHRLRELVEDQEQERELSRQPGVLGTAPEETALQGDSQHFYFSDLTPPLPFVESS